MEQLYLRKINKIEGQVDLVGSKSLTNRALLLSALAKGTTSLSNILLSDDTKYMLEALTKLKVNYTQDDNKIVINGLDGTFSVDGCLNLFLGNAGTAMRPLSAALAISKGSYILEGVERMYSRPIAPLVDSLNSLGLKLSYMQKEGYPPLKIEGAKALSNTVAIRGDISSQYLSALLIIAPMLEQGLTINVIGDLISKPYIDLTIKLIEHFGAKVSRDGYTCFKVEPTKYQSPKTYLVEGDASGATYFMAAAAIKGHVKITGLGRNSIQGDIKFIDVLRQMGAHIDVYDDYLEVFQSQLSGIDIDMNDMPDAAMTLVPMALYTTTPVNIRNIASWRVKETDRITAMAEQMSKLGVKVLTTNDSIFIDASTRNQDIVDFDTYDDHRMAMCMSLIALDRDIIINDPKCVNKTFPQYFEFLAKISV